jgi:uncharacterized metal-binding protein YceD (DUF177 family)
MTRDENRTPITRPLRVDEIKDEARGEVAATPAEMASIARMLDLVKLERLALGYRLTRGGEGRLRLSGRLTAEVTQTCVVSLEPVDASIDVPVEVEFWPAPLFEALERSAEEPGHSGVLDWPEPIVDGKIDLGPLVYETLATTLDPYPKREGASFAWPQEDAGPSEPSQAGPFAALAALKRR